MTVGVPVVAARAGSIPEVAGDAALLVEPTDERRSPTRSTACSPTTRPAPSSSRAGATACTRSRGTTRPAPSRRATAARGAAWPHEGRGPRRAAAAAGAGRHRPLRDRAPARSSPTTASNRRVRGRRRGRAASRRRVPWIDLGRPARQRPLRALAPAPPAASPHRRRRRARAEPGGAAGRATARSSSPSTTSRSSASPRHDATRRGFHARGSTLARRDASLVIVPSHFTRAELEAEGFDARAHRRRSLRRRSRPCRAIPTRSTAPSRRRRAASVRAHRRHRRAAQGHPHPRARGRATPRGRTRLTLVVSARPVGATCTGSTARSCRSSAHNRGRCSTRLYRRADVFCLASLYEGFGLPVVEAMARGAPTVATTGSAARGDRSRRGRAVRTRRRRRLRTGNRARPRRRSAPRETRARGRCPRRRAELGSYAPKVTSRRLRSARSRDASS